MKIHGKQISGANVEYAVIPRPSGHIVFKCEAILDYKEFEQLVPEPKPGIKMLPGGKMEPNPDDASYKNQIKDFNGKRFDFMVIKSLQGTEGFEWDTVKLTDPNTWKNYETEFKDSGFTQNEINYIVMQCMTANSLNQEKLEQAQKGFFSFSPGGSRTLAYPDGRSQEYAVWRACERFHLLPPEVKLSWDDNDVITQAKLIAYDEIRLYEQSKYDSLLSRVRGI